MVGADQVASAATKQSVLAIRRLVLSRAPQNIVGNFAITAEAVLMEELNAFASGLLLGRCFNLMLLRFFLDFFYNLFGSLLTLVS